MKRYLISGAMLMLGMALIAAALIASSPTYASNDTTVHDTRYRPPLHGTPDPNATPDTDPHGGSVENPTYYADVEPILVQNCMSCHVEGEIGYAFFPMDDINAITDPLNADYIAFVTGIDYMPPWPLGEQSLPMNYERSLTAEEKAILATWAENGAPLGDEADRNIDGIVPDVPDMREDLVLQLPEYTPNQNLTDDYRCFLVDPGFTEDTYLTGTHLIPGNTEIAHHSIYFVVSEAEVEMALERDGADGRPGWPCYGGPGLTRRGGNAALGLGNIDQQDLVAAITAQGGDIAAIISDLQAIRENPSASAASDVSVIGEVLTNNGIDIQLLLADLNVDVAAATNSGMSGGIGGWVPGGVPVLAPENSGLLVPAGSQLVIQMHYNTLADDGSDQSTMLLQIEEASDNMTAIISRPFLAPVEIPCPAGLDSPECDRANQDNATSDGLMGICGQTLDFYAENTAENAYSMCDYTMSTDGWIISMGPHMHEIGKAARITLNPDTPEETILIDIPEWDFHWQGSYDFETPVTIERGDTLRVECWWDNSDGERYVVWGEGTQDEMCFHFHRFLPKIGDATLADYGFTPDDTGMAMDMDSHDHSTHDHGEHDHGEHNHETLVELSADAPIPAVEMTVTPTASGGYFVQLDVENFDFAPEAVDGAHVEGQGHAHLYVNGEKITRLYSEEYFIDSLPAGAVEIRVTLNTNDHSTYALDGAPIEAVVNLSVE